MRDAKTRFLAVAAILCATQPTLAQNRACCLGNGSCLDTNLAGCDASFGEFLAGGTTCATTACIGACCLDGKTCVEDNRDGCGTAGGTFQGPNTTCERHCPAKMSTVFTYQGQLKQAGVPLSGTADLEFSLWTSAKGGDQVGATVLRENISVAGGLLSIPLGFGGSVFNGNARWLEISVRSPHDPGDTNPFTTLLPRQAITGTPYSLQTRGLFVDNEGHVGIGTISPQYLLHVENSDSTHLIYGQNTATGGFTCGVAGEINSPNGFAVSGFANSVAGEGYGGYFMAKGDQGYGVYAETTATSGATHAVYGVARSDNGIGVFGRGKIGIFGRTFRSDGFAGAFYGGRSYFQGNVGIGVLEPTSKLHLAGLESVTLTIEADTDNAGGETQHPRILFSQDGGAVTARLGYGDGLNQLELVNEFNDSLNLGTNNQSRLTIDGDGNVGIGTSTPAARLDVASESTTTPSIVTRGGHDYATVTGEGIDFGHWDGSTFTRRMRISPGGNVGIGTSNPQGKLDVNGAIYQRGGQLHADYVFVSEYELESIEEHSAFMWSQRHLPAVPRARKDAEGREIVEVGSHRRGILEELEKAHIYIERLNAEKDCLEERLATVETEAVEKDNRLVTLEERFARLEGLMLQRNRDVQGGER